MLVRELIAQLQALPQDLEVVVYDRGGCPECDPDGIGGYSEIYDVEHGSRHVDGYGRSAREVVVL